MKYQVKKVNSTKNNQKLDKSKRVYLLSRSFSYFYTFYYKNKSKHTISFCSLLSSFTLEDIWMYIQHLSTHFYCGGGAFCFLYLPKKTSEKK